MAEVVVVVGVCAPKLFLELIGLPFSKRCSALGDLASFLTDCFNRPIRPLLELEVVGEATEETVGDAAKDPLESGLSATAAEEEGANPGELVGGCCAVVELRS